MSHPIAHALKQINSDFDVNNDIQPDFCNACQFGKYHMQHFSSTETTTIQPLEFLLVDLWGKAPLLSFLDYQYYMFIVDDFTRFTWICHFTIKSKAL